MLALGVCTFLYLFLVCRFALYFRRNLHLDYIQALCQSMITFNGIRYAGWCAAYQALAWRVLKTSQQFYHDDYESRQGMLSALMLLPVILGTGCVDALVIYIHC